MLQVWICATSTSRYIRPHFLSSPSPWPPLVHAEGCRGSPEVLISVSSELIFERLQGLSLPVTKNTHPSSRFLLTATPEKPLFMPICELCAIKMQPLTCVVLVMWCARACAMPMTSLSKFSQASRWTKWRWQQRPWRGQMWVTLLVWWLMLNITLRVPTMD